MSSGFDPIAEAARQWATRWGETNAGPMMAVTSLMRAQQILMTRLNELLKPLALTFPSYEALMLLHFSSQGALPLGRMGQLLQVHPTSVTNTIDHLERRALVERKTSPNDRRQTLAAITDDGRAVAEHATNALNNARFATGPLASDDLQQLSKILLPLRAAADNFSPTDADTPTSSAIPS